MKRWLVLLGLLFSSEASAAALMPIFTYDTGTSELSFQAGSGTARIVCTVSGPACSMSVDAGSLTGTTLAANVVNSSLTSVGTLAGGATGAGFTIGLTVSTVTGNLPCANFPALTGNVTTSAGSCATTIAAYPAALLASAAEVRAGTSTTKTVTPSALNGSQAIQTLTDAATIAWDMATGYNAAVTIGASRALGAPTNFHVGQTYTLLVTQGGAGSFLMTWPGSFNWGAIGAPVLTTTAGKTDMIQLICVTSAPAFYATYVKGF